MIEPAAAPFALDAPSRAGANAPRLSVERFSFWYGDKQALRDVSFELFHSEALAFIGQSGCGKSTMLRCLNRMNDHIPSGRGEGRIELDGSDIRDPRVDPPLLRRRCGWVAQRANPFPRSVYENVAYPARLHGLVADGAAMDAHVEACLRAVGLWDEVAGALDGKATALSGGQQQRLCIARALSQQPQVLLMDEPCGAVDPVGAARIEALLIALKRTHSLIIITHNLAQARRVADRVAFFHLGQLIEIGPTEQIFTAPRTLLCAEYVAERSGLDREKRRDF